MRKTYLISLILSFLFLNGCSTEQGYKIVDRDTVQLRESAPESQIPMPEPEPVSAPELDLKQTQESSYDTWDFGQVQEGVVLEHDFILHNDTLNILNIINTDTSCGCAVSKVEKNSLSPGESASIKVTFNTAGYSGPVQQHVFVNTDHPENPVIRFTIAAEVVK